MQNDKYQNINKKERKMTEAELLTEIEREKEALRLRGVSEEDINKPTQSGTDSTVLADSSGAECIKTAIFDGNDGADSENASSNDTESEADVKKTVFKKIGKAFYIALDAILILILAVNVYMIAARSIFKKENPTLFGLAYAVVLTDSMNGDRPDSIEGNSLIFTVKQKSYEVDDVVMFEAASLGTVTHRIIGTDADGYITKGDANNESDKERIDDGDIVGRVFFVIPKLGYVIRWLTTPVGLLVLTCVCLGTFGIPLLFASDDKEEE